MMFSCLNTFGQFGVHTGGVLSDMNITGVGQDYDSNLKPGFFAGLFFRKNFTPSVAIQPELNWVQKGAVTNSEEDKLKITLNYLEVPVYFLYTSPTGNGFFGGAGPSINFGLRGRVKNGDQKHQVDFGNDSTSDLLGYHFGLNILAGYTLKNGLQISGFTGFSLSDSNPLAGEYNDVMDIKFFHFGIRLGYIDKK
jgi:hypothetical protein